MNILRPLQRTFISSALATMALSLAPLQVQAEPESITISTGSTGGSWYPIGAGMAKIFADNGVLANSEPGGAISNLVNVSNGTFEVGFSMAALIPMAASGQEPFPEAYANVRALAVFGRNFTHIVVTDDSEITSVDGLAGQRVGSFQRGSMGSLAFLHVLEAASVPADDMTLFLGGQSYQADQVRDRRTVGMSTSSAFPSGTITELMTSIDMSILPMDDALFERLLEINPGYLRTTLPAGTYPGQDEDIPGAGTTSILTVSADMSDEDAYWIVKTLHENLEEIQGIHASLRSLTPETLANVGEVPMHPGAQRYFTEVGLLR